MDFIIAWYDEKKKIHVHCYFLYQDKRLEELRRILRRYKKIEELVAQAQGRKSKSCQQFIVTSVCLSDRLNVCPK